MNQHDQVRATQVLDMLEEVKRIDQQERARRVERDIDLVWLDSTEPNIDRVSYRELWAKGRAL